MASVVSGFSRTVIALVTDRRGYGWSAGISLREPFRQPGKTALHFDPDADRGGPGYSSIALINDRLPGYPHDRVTLDQTAAKCLAPRLFS